MRKLLGLIMAVTAAATVVEVPADAAIRYVFSSPGFGPFAGHFTYLSPTYISTPTFVPSSSLTECDVTFHGSSAGCSGASFNFFGPNSFLIFSTIGFNFGPGGYSTLGVHTDGTIATLSVASVPESATWMFMLTGFGGLGAMLRFKRAVGKLA